MALSTKTLYKAFLRGEDGNLRTKFGSQDLTYKVGETYTTKGTIEMDRNGYHACQDPFECLGYYGDSPGCVMAEIRGDKEYGFIVSRSQVCFHSYAIKRIIPKEEWQTGTYISLTGTQRWYKDGKRHRDGDEPAVIYPVGTREWYKNGELHRDGDEPAVIYPGGGTRYWYKNGELHRDGDEPAVIEPGGTRYWYKNGELHRDGDEPAVIESDGTREWYKNGKLHREGDEPAVIYACGTRYWCKNGYLHREGDEPAIIRPDGNLEWYKNGKKSRK